MVRIVSSEISEVLKVSWTQRDSQSFEGGYRSVRVRDKSVYFQLAINSTEFCCRYTFQARVVRMLTGLSNIANV